MPPPKRKRRKKSQDKRLKVDVWVSDGLREAIGVIVRDDGKPANDVQVRAWVQEYVDTITVKVTDLHEEHGDALKHTVV